MEANKSSEDSIQKKEDVQKSNDEHIDQDFPGYPHHPSKPNVIRPKSEPDKVNANAEDDIENPEEDGTYPESSDSSSKQSQETDEISSDGSAGAFGATEEVKE